METKNSLFISFGNQLDLDSKQVKTLPTASSIEINENFSISQDFTFSSIKIDSNEVISQTDKFFISDKTLPYEFQSLDKVQSSSSKRNICSLEKIISFYKQVQNEQKSQILLKTDTENGEQDLLLSEISLEMVNVDQLDFIQITEDQALNEKLKKSDQKLILAQFPVQALKHVDNSKTISCYLQNPKSHFQRKLFSLTKSQISLNKFQYPDSQKQIIIKYDNKKLSFKIIFPLKKCVSFEQLQESLKTKSSLLNEVISIKELKGILLQLCQQNMGSRIVQKLIHLSPQQTIKAIYKQLDGKFDFLMMDKYGNYVVQKIFSNLQESQKIEFLKNIKSNIITIATTKFGTHCLQFLLKKCHKSVECIKVLQQSVTPKIFDLSTNEFGTHFIQELLHYQKEKTIQTYLLTEDNLVKNCNNKFGILTVKKLMLKICTQSKINIQNRTIFLQQVYKNFNIIGINEYGHFLIEQLPKYYQQHELQWILWMIVFDLPFYANIFFASSIIRLYLDIFSQVLFYVNCQTWLNPIVYHSFSSYQKVLSLMETKSGSFLLHKLLAMVDYFTKTYMLKTITDLIESIKDLDRKKKWKKFIKNHK